MNPKNPETKVYVTKVTANVKTHAVSLSISPCSILPPFISLSSPLSPLKNITYVAHNTQAPLAIH